MKLGAANRIRLVGEKVKDSPTLDKVGQETKKAAKRVVFVVCEGAGFLHWSLMKAIRPVSRKVRESYEKYRGSF